MGVLWFNVHNATLADLVGIDRFRLRAPVSVRDLAHFRDPQAILRPVRIKRSLSGVEATHEASLIGFSSSADETTRTVDALILIEDPLELEPPLVLGEYVEVDLPSDRIVSGVRIPRRALHDESRVHIVTPDGRLEVRQVTVAFGDRDSVVVSEGLDGGDRVILSRLGAAVPGMPIDVATSSDPIETTGAERDRKTETDG
ncbi:MAG: hypothetical protein HC923_07465 [Myxococcales bacterium]|nr:hypothetical protein [Myxococcales bacterium]